MNISRLPEVMTYGPPASADSIARVQARLHTELPHDYAGLLAQADGVVANRFVLYSCEDLLERNVTFEVGLYAPGYVTIGDDNGGLAIMLRSGPGHSPVFLVGHGTMSPEDMVQVASDSKEWIQLGCPLQKDYGST